MKQVKRLLSGFLAAIAPLVFAAACSKAPSETTAKYECDSGQTIVVEYEGRTGAAITYDGRTRKLAFLTTGSRTRYGGDNLEWATAGDRVGSKAELFRQSAGIATGAALEVCRRVE